MGHIDGGPNVNSHRPVPAAFAASAAPRRIVRRTQGRYPMLRKILAIGAIVAGLAAVALVSGAQAAPPGAAVQSD